MGHMRVLIPVFGVSALLSVVAALFDVALASQCALVALLVLAVCVVLVIEPPRRRWLLVAGVMLLATTPAIRLWFDDDLGPLLSMPTGEVATELARHWHHMVVQARLVGAGVLLAVVAFAAVVYSLPAKPRPRRALVVAVLCAATPIVLLALEVARRIDNLGPASGPAGGFFVSAAPELLATLIAAFMVVVATGRADRWLLLPAGALLLEATAALGAVQHADTWLNWAIARPRPDTGTFLSVGIMISSGSPSVDVIGAVATALTVVAPALMVVATARR